MRAGVQAILFVTAYAMVSAAMGASIVYFHSTDNWLYVMLVPLFLAAFFARRGVYISMMVVLAITAYCTAWGTGSDMSNSTRVIAGVVLLTIMFSEIMGSLGRERRRALQALRTERHFLQAIQQTTRDAIRVFSSEGPLLWQNAAAERLFGVAGPPLQLTGTRSNGDRDSAYGAVLESKEPAEFACVLERTGREPCTLWVRLEPMIDEQGAAYAVMETSSDITEHERTREALKGSEQRYRQLVECSPGMVWQIDVGGRIAYISSACREMLGYDPEELTGADMTSTLTEESGVRAREMHARAVEHPEDRSVHTTELEMRRKDGSVYPAETRYTAVHDDHECFLGFQGITHDISERVEAAERLRSSEEMTRALLDATTDIAFLVSLDGRLLTLNRNVVQTFGLEEEALRGENVSMFLPEAGLSLFTAHLEDAARRVLPARYETILHRRLYDINIHPVVEHDGRVIRLAVFMRDVTALRETERALDESERTFMEIFQASSDSAILIENGLVIDCNAAALRLMGFDRAEEYIGSSPDATSPEYQPDGRLSVEKAEEVQVIALREGAHQFEWVQLRKDGKELLLNVNLTAIPLYGRRILHSVSRDFGAVRRAQEERTRLATAIEQAEESVMVTDTSGRIEYVNPAFERVSGYPAAAVLGRTTSFLHSGRHSDAFYQELWDTISDGRTWQGRFINRKSDGTLFHEDATISPVRDEEGRIINFVALKRDVTREILLEQQLRQAQKMQAIGTLAGGIAHDFNNILSLIVGHAEVGRGQLEPNHAGRENLEQILKASQRAADLVAQVLTFSRREEQERQLTRIDVIVREVARFFRATLPANVRLRHHIQRKPGLVFADPTQVHQVVMNLCTNGFQAMRETGGMLTLTLDTVDLEAPYYVDAGEIRTGRYVHLAVSDTGEGMEPEVIQRVFEPFFTTNPAGEGTGLGLPVVHGIVTGSDGAIRIDSAVGQGATMHVYLPYHEQGQADDLEAAAEARGGTERVFVVDDDEGIATIIAYNLRRAGYTVETFENPESALVAVHTANPPVDVVITDYMMPEMNGVELARRIHETRQELPVILMSGYTDLARRKPDAGEHIRGFVRKPPTTVKLCEAIRNALA
jgi:PAS domain S-box-containing protein